MCGYARSDCIHKSAETTGPAEAVSDWCGHTLALHTLCMIWQVNMTTLTRLVTKKLVRPGSDQPDRFYRAWASSSVSLVCSLAYRPWKISRLTCRKKKYLVTYRETSGANTHGEKKQGQFLFSMQETCLKLGQYAHNTHIMQ